MDPGLIATLASWLYLALLAALIATVVLRRREPASSLAWSLTIVFLPVLGPLLFLLLGVNRVPRRVRKKIAHRERFQDAFQQAEHHGGATDAGYPDSRWGTLERLLEDLGGGPRCTGNRLELFSGGAEAFRAAARAIEEARHHVHVEYYIFRDDRLGQATVDLLRRKLREGVEVRLLVDGLGSVRAWRLLRSIRQAGGASASFLPILSPKRVSPNIRNHRKIIVCDGRVGFFGGMNVGDEYLGSRGQAGRDWYDLHMRVEGPAVGDLQQIFVEDWDYATGELLNHDAYFPEPSHPGSSPVQVIWGGPDFDTNPIRQAFFGAMTRARSSIHLASPYLAPDLALREALTNAARSGVDVRLVTQAPPPDQYLVYYCGQYYTEEFLEAGVRVYEYRPGMMHAKAITIDGEWGMLGTANFDNRSMFLNFEQMAVFDGPSVVGCLEEELRRLVERSTELDRVAFENRPRLERIASAGARLLAPLL